MRIAFTTNYSSAQLQQLHTWQAGLVRNTTFHELRPIPLLVATQAAAREQGHRCPGLKQQRWANRQTWRRAMYQFWSTIFPRVPGERPDPNALLDAINVVLPLAATHPNSSPWLRPTSTDQLMRAFEAHCENVALPPISVRDAAHIATAVDNAFFAPTFAPKDCELTHAAGSGIAGLAALNLAIHHETPFVVTLEPAHQPFSQRLSRPGLPQAQYVATALRQALDATVLPTADYVIVGSVEAAERATYLGVDHALTVPIAAPPNPASSTDWDIFAQRYDWVYRQVMPCAAPTSRFDGDAHPAAATEPVAVCAEPAPYVAPEPEPQVEVLPRQIGPAPVYLELPAGAFPGPTVAAELLAMPAVAQQYTHSVNEPALVIAQVNLATALRAPHASDQWVQARSNPGCTDPMELRIWTDPTELFFTAEQRAELAAAQSFPTLSGSTAPSGFVADTEDTMLPAACDLLPPAQSGSVPNQSRQENQPSLAPLLPSATQHEHHEAPEKPCDLDQAAFPTVPNSPQELFAPGMPAPAVELPAAPRQRIAKGRLRQRIIDLRFIKSHKKQPTPSPDDVFAPASPAHEATAQPTGE